LRVAIVHDWLTGMRGGEMVLEALLALHPEAEIFTLLHDRGSVSRLIEDRPIHTSYLQHIPGAAQAYRYLLPLFPHAIERLDLSGFELVWSSSHCVAKGAHTPDGVPHLSYCHTPMRYVWDQYDAYFGAGRARWPVRAAMHTVAPRLRAWDVRTAHRVDRFVANSRHVAERIRRYFSREAVVIHPPVDLGSFTPVAEKGDYYLVLGAPSPYKRVDVAVEACRLLGRRLVLAGYATGLASWPRPGRRSLPANVEVRGYLSRKETAAVLAGARALLLPGVEDFGITVVEALASGTPIIARGEGGVLDSVRPVGVDSELGPPTGVFFEESTPEALAGAIRRFEAHDFDTDALVEASAPFAVARFLDAVRDFERAALGAATGA
jgi:glycosyltransferase involved in cell wall biosynthesis